MTAVSRMLPPRLSENFSPIPAIAPPASAPMPRPALSKIESRAVTRSSGTCFSTDWSMKSDSMLPEEKARLSPLMTIATSKTHAVREKKNML